MDNINKIKIILEERKNIIAIRNNARGIFINSDILFLPK